MKKIIWKVSSKDVNQASFRYRCMMPLQWMKKLDPNTRHVVADNSDITLINKNVKAIIFVKSFSKNDLALAKKAKEAGIPIYIDLCDNFFYRHKIGFYDNEREKILLAEAYEIFQTISSWAKTVVTTGEELAAKIVEEFPTLDAKIKIIHDSIESSEDIAFFDLFKNNPKAFKDPNFFGVLLKVPKYLFNKKAYSFLYRSLRKKVLSKLKEENTLSPPPSTIN